MEINRRMFLALAVTGVLVGGKQLVVAADDDVVHVTLDVQGMH